MVSNKLSVQTLSLTLLLSLVIACDSKAPQPEETKTNTVETPAAPEKVDHSTFLNPLFDNGADPWLEYFDGNYYLTTTTWTSRLVMRKSPTLAGLSTAAPVNIWSETLPDRCCNFWAFEFHRLKGPDGFRWYVMYTSGQNGTLDHQHLSVIESVGDDPMGPYEYKGSPMPNTWNIDGNYLEHNGKLYLLWSEWVDDEQLNWIALMTDPWTITGEKVVFSRPTYEWELKGRKVNEGPEVIKHNGKTFVVFSASFCDTPDYKLGLQELTGEDPMIPASWTKYPDPIFEKTNSVFGPGHNGFFSSPDGTEDWLIYHGNSSATDGCSATRSVRAQKFTWNADDTPNFGKPVASGTPVQKPSGENGPLTVTLQGAPMQIVSRANDLCLSVKNKSQVDQQQCDAQHWIVDATGEGYFRLGSQEDGNFIGAGCSADNTQLQHSPWINTACQQWKLETTDEGWITLRNKKTSTPLSLAACKSDPENPEACQQWRLQPSGALAISSAQSGKVLSVADCATTAGSNVEQNEWKNKQCQQWTFKHTENAFYEISTNANTCLSVADAAMGAGANIEQNSCGSQHSQWQLNFLPDGAVSFEARLSKKTLNLSSCGLANKTNIAQAPWLDTICQRFYLRSVD